MKVSKLVRWLSDLTNLSCRLAISFYISSATHTVDIVTPTAA